MNDNERWTGAYEEDPCEGCPYFKDGCCEAEVGVPCPEGDEEEYHLASTS